MELCRTVMVIEQGEQGVPTAQPGHAGNQNKKQNCYSSSEINFSLKCMENNVRLSPADKDTCAVLKRKQILFSYVSWLTFMELEFKIPLIFAVNIEH